MESGVNFFAGGYIDVFNTLLRWAEYDRRTTR